MPLYCLSPSVKAFPLIEILDFGGLFFLMYSLLSYSAELRAKQKSVYE